MPTVTLHHPNSTAMKIRRLLGIPDDKIVPHVDALIQAEMRRPTISLDRIRRQILSGDGGGEKA